MNRRMLLSGAALALPLPFIAACGMLPTTSGGNLAQAQAYGADLANALSAGAVVFLAGPPKPTDAQAALVNQAVADIQTANAALAAATAQSTATGFATQLLNAALKLSSLVIPSLGPAGPYVPLAIAVLQAFIGALPPPDVVPAVPPAALHRAALKYHAH